MRTRWLAALTIVIVCGGSLSTAPARSESTLHTNQGTNSVLRQRRVLVYTRNGVGYVHANIAASVAALKKAGAEAGFAVDATEDPGAFSAENLKRYAVIVFSNSNNEIFTSDEQRAALKGFVERGGGVVGVHSSIGSERNWEWFAQMMGGRFRWHPVEQDFEVKVADAGFPVVQGLPATFKVHDECYFDEKLNPDIHPVVVTDRTALQGLDKAPVPGDGLPESVTAGVVAYV